MQDASNSCAQAQGNWLCYKETPPKSDSVTCACSEDVQPISRKFPIPNNVHFVLTDRDTRFFDWPCYVAIRSAWEKLQPDKLLVHVLDGIEPNTSADWWHAAKSYITAVVPFPRSDVPLSLNGVKVIHPAFIADFRRIQILYDWGGIYMDTDALSLRSFDDLRGWKAVLGRQGGQELRATVGLMMFEKKSQLLLSLLDRMKRAYTGAWGVHAGSPGTSQFCMWEFLQTLAYVKECKVKIPKYEYRIIEMLDGKTKDSKWPANRNDVFFMFVFSSLRRHVLDDMLQELHPKGVSILGHSTGFFASSWLAEDFVELMEESGQVDWSRCWSLHLYNSQTKILE